MAPYYYHIGRLMNTNNVLFFIILNKNTLKYVNINNFRSPKLCLYGYNL